MKLHDCPDCSHEYTLHSKVCKRCSYNWSSKNEHPTYCPKCKSPYWNLERKAQRYSEVYALMPGQGCVVPWPETGPYNGHPVKRIAKALGFTVEWKEDGAHITNPAIK